ncbi:autotransporter domain-containing protein [Pseudoxanthomonas sp.]|uniref:autotransporter domain-containing protein n=1 Tax=Pseudoxanthomonas sp. TaxID=1871049 RepID=UPI0026342E61|nr:autotransporter domain-containing protein [Pseudoxanthomonas sp.]WDS35720.1 MAG: autotransporter domain-containing protein [Pseudoxanthomonas sp.]
MNRIYRLVFNRQLGVMQVASELACSMSAGASAGNRRKAPSLRPFALCLLHALWLGCAGTASAAQAVVFNGDDRIDSEIVYKDGFIVGSDEAGALRIVNGGHVTADRSLVGEQTGGTGTLTIDGPDALLKFHNSAFQYVSGALVIGNEGTGALQVLNGGRAEELSNGQTVYFARAAGSYATALVDGQGSLLQAHYFNLGYAGSGSATVSSGGRIVSTSDSATSLDIAYAAGSNFALNVLGAGSEFSAKNTVVVGRGGNGVLDVRDGAAFRTTGQIWAGLEEGASGDISVDGAGSVLSAGRTLAIGQGGSGSLNVTGSASVVAASLQSGYASGATATLMVDGAGSSISTGTGDFLLGVAGTADLAISNGGRVEVGDLLMGDGRNANGSIVVDGASSQLTASGDVTVGNSGKATLAIRNGGQVSAASMLLSNALITASDNTTGSVTVDGQGSTLTIADDGLLTVGGTGNGTLDITNGGHVSAGDLTIGGNRSGYRPNNALTISGAGSTLDVKQELSVGGGTNGRLQVSDGAKVVTGTLTQEVGSFGSDTYSGGVIAIEGGGSQLTAEDLQLRSQFTLKDGAQVSTDTVTFENTKLKDVQSTALITGSGTRLDASGELSLFGRVKVADGATVTAGSMESGWEVAGYLSRSELQVTGAGSSVLIKGDIVLGGQPALNDGSLVLTDGGRLDSGSNSLRLNSNTSLAFGAGFDTTLSGTGGSLQLAEAQASGELDGDDVITFSGTGLLALNHTSDDLILANTLVSAAYNTSASTSGQILANAGATQLTGDLHAFNGDINVQGGTLVINSDLNTLPANYNIDSTIGKSYQEISVGGNGRLVLNSNVGYQWQYNASGIVTVGSTSVTVRGDAAGEAPVFAGNGSVTGEVRVGDGGVISPGDGDVGTLVIKGDLYFTGVTVERPGVFAVDVRGDGSSDQLQVSGITYLHDPNYTNPNPSKVQVTALDPATSYQNGQTYTVLHADGGIKGTFDTVTSQSAFLTPTLTYTANDVVLGIALSTANLPVTVGNGQTLSGNGSYGTTQVLSGGTLSPGTADARIGALQFNGDLSFAAGSFYDVDVKGTNASASASSIRAAAVSTVNDLVNVTGKATLDGGTVRVTALDPQTSYQDGHAYTIVHADGGVSGTFAGSASRSAFLTTKLSYTANDVVLGIGLVATGGEDPGTPGIPGTPGTGLPPPIFETVATTRNQYNAALALDTLPQSGEALALYNNLLLLDAEQARTAFGSLSGEVHTAARAALLEDRFLRDGVNQRLSGQVTGMAEDGFGVWVAGNGSSGHIDGDANAARIEGQRQGLMGGVDWTLGEDTVLGVVAGNEDITQRVRQWQSKADIDATEVGLYAATRLGALFLRGGVNYADYDVDTARQAVVGTSINQSIGASYDAHALTVYAEGGWAFSWDTLTLTPYVALAHTRLETDDATEAGGSTALVVAKSKDELLTSTAGVRAAWDISGGQVDGAIVTAGLAWQNASGELKADSRARFAAGGDAFTVYGTPLARNVAIAELGVGVNTGANARLSLSAQGRAGDGQREVGAQLNWAWKF